MARVIPLTVALLACSAGPAGGETPRGTDLTTAAPSQDVEEGGARADSGTPPPPTPATAAPDASAAATPPPETPPASVAKAEPEPPRVIRFPWCPSKRVATAYEMSEPPDQHRLVLTPGVEPGGRYPVVLAFHGQPKRGKPPREYGFTERVEALVVELVRSGELQPVILVLPVFRFVGSNWPYFNPRAFRREVERLLLEQQVEGGDWFAFGHSGAAGCGGGGLNQIHLIEPAAVGFFDTCLGQGWVDELAALREAGIRTVNIHSVETAAFRPRQRPEYQSTFDFGRAYGPAGMRPVKCPAEHPGERLREQRYRCAASPDEVIEGFVIDSGEGAEAHRAMVDPAVRFFLLRFSGLGR